MDSLPLMLYGLTHFGGFRSPKAMTDEYRPNILFLLLRTYQYRTFRCSLANFFGRFTIYTFTLIRFSYVHQIQSINWFMKSVDILY